jgi:hypothetical protein
MTEERGREAGSAKRMYRRDDTLNELPVEEVKEEKNRGSMGLPQKGYRGW